MRVFSDRKPNVLEEVGNGNWLYRWGFREEEVPEMHIGDDSEEVQETRTQWSYKEATIVGQPDYGKLVSAVIRHDYSADEELALINKYNSYQKGISEDASIVEEYEGYLTFVNNTKIQVRQDLTSTLDDTNFNIETLGFNL